MNSLMGFFRTIGLYRFITDRSAVAAVEFALILPLFLTLYVGALELSSAVITKRKVELSASVVSEIVSQTPRATQAEMRGILDVAASTASPIPITDMRIVLNIVGIDAHGDPTIASSFSTDANAVLIQGSVPAFTIPANLLVPNTQVIVSSVEHEHKAAFADISRDILGRDVYQFESRSFTRPRFGRTIDILP